MTNDEGARTSYSLPNDKLSYLSKLRHLQTTILMSLSYKPLIYCLLKRLRVNLEGQPNSDPQPQTAQNLFLTNGLALNG